MKRSIAAALLLLLCCTGCGSAPKQQAPLSTEPVTTEAVTETEPFTVPETVLETEPETVPETEPFTEPETAPETEPPTEPEAETEPPTEAAPIFLTDTDGNGTDYTFTYGGEVFSASYTPDNWKIVNSYKVTDPAAIVRICEALKAEHPIHTADLQSWRTAEDMAYEWEQHNLAYEMLPDDSPWKASVRDVDIDPKDQGKSLSDMYQDRLQ